MKIKSGFVLEEVGGSYIAVAVGARAKEFSGLVRLNETGAFLWERLAAADVSREELLAAMLAEFDVPSDVALADITAFERKLAENGILENE